jgi:methylated-DNA-[protein]-cysteine S-methyltransferase
MKKLLNILKKIPKGKITTYSILAKKLKTNPRAIARLLSKNPHPDKYPCYKVVLSSGKIGGYNLGVKEKIKRLKKEGIKIRNNIVVDFEKVLFE